MAVIRSSTRANGVRLLATALIAVAVGCPSSSSTPVPVTPGLPGSGGSLAGRAPFQFEEVTERSGVSLQGSCADNS